MNILSSASKKTSSIFQELADAPAIAPIYAFPVTAPVLLALGAGVFTACLATETGRAILSEIKRRRRLREKLPASPSLRGSPTPEELEADGALFPRTLAIRLRIGSRLADLEPTLARTYRHKKLPNGQKRLAARAPGLKGWLADRRVTLNYSTLVRYKKLAQRLRQLLALDDRLPLEWLLPGASPDRPLPADLQAPCSAARRRLARLLREHRNFDRLRKHVEAKLGIPELLTVRRNARRAKDAARSRRWLAKQKPIHCQSVVLGDYTVNADPTRLDATAQAFARFLREKDLPPKLAAHRDRFLRQLADATACQKKLFPSGGGGRV